MEFILAQKRVHKQNSNLQVLSNFSFRVKIVELSEKELTRNMVRDRDSPTVGLSQKS